MLCKYDILGALSELCRRMALIKIPKYCYGDVIRNIQRVSYDDAIREYEERFAQEVDLPLDIKAFEETLTEQERIACRMKQRGYSSRERNGSIRAAVRSCLVWICAHTHSRRLLRRA